jgi:hypothetical protein
MEIISLRNRFGQEVGPDNYLKYMEVAKEKAMEIAEQFIKNENFEFISNISEIYPYSLYDFECKNGYCTNYYMVFYTTSNNEYFNISSKKLKFLNDFKDNVTILVLTNVLDDVRISKYNVEQILSFTKSINSLMLRKE